MLFLPLSLYRSVIKLITATTLSSSLPSLRLFILVLCGICMLLIFKFIFMYVDGNIYRYIYTRVSLYVYLGTIICVQALKSLLTLT